MVIGAVAGFFGGFLNPILGAVIYERVPARLQARVIGVFKSGAWVGIPLGSLAGGALAQYAGLTASLWVCGAIMLAEGAVVTIAVFAWLVLSSIAEAEPAV